MSELDESVRTVLGMLEGDREAKDILHGLESGDLTPADAYTKLLHILEQDHGEDLKGMAAQFPMKIPILDSVPVAMTTEEGIPMLNPLIEAAIAERAALDGDVPHLRTGPLPPGAVPAVPIEVTASDPVMVGMMLQRAADKVHAAIRLAIEEHNKTAEKQIAEAAGSGIQLAPEMLPAPTGVEGYKAGQVPTAIQVTAPTIEEVGALTPAERRSAARMAIATTQGRTSLCPVVERMVIEKLASLGIEASSGPTGEGALTVSWAVHTWADDEIQAEFSPLESASAAIASKIQAATQAGRVVIEVIPINGVAERHFGWAAKVRPEGDER